MFWALYPLPPSSRAPRPPPSTSSLPTSKHICFFPTAPPHNLKNALRDFSRGSLDKRCCRKTSSNEDVRVPLCQQRTWSITWSRRKSPTPTLAATSQSSRALTTSRTQSWRSGTRRTWRLYMRRCRTFTVRRKRAWSNVSGDIGPLLLLLFSKTTGFEVETCAWIPLDSHHREGHSTGRAGCLLPSGNHVCSLCQLQRQCCSPPTLVIHVKGTVSVAWLVCLSCGDRL